MPDRRIRMLFLPRERFPTFRVDVDVLFGRELAGRGHCIDFVMQAEGPGVPLGARQWHGRTVWVGPTDTKDGFVHRLRKHLLSVLHDLRALARLRPGQYDVVQVKDKLLVAAIAIPLARWRGVRYFYWLSFPVPEALLLRARTRTARYPLLTLLRGLASGWLLYRWIMPRADHVFVQSARMKEDVCRKGVDPNKVTPVPMGIDMADFAGLGAVAAPQVRAGGPVLGYLGTLDADRRLGILVEMLALLRAGGHAARLLLIGDAGHPRDRAALLEDAQRLGVADQIEITGFLPRSQALRRLLEADICLCPMFPTPILLSTSTTKLVEYLALGLPVVANDHPDHRVVLRGSRAGVRVPWGARYFARAVTWLMRRSAAERAAMGQSGRAWVQANRRYDLIADSLERTYLQLLASDCTPVAVGAGKADSP